MDQEQLNFSTEFYNNYSSYLKVVVWYKNAEGGNSWKDMSIKAPDDYSANNILKKALSYLPAFAKNGTFLVEVTTPENYCSFGNNFEGGNKVLRAARILESNKS